MRSEVVFVQAVGADVDSAISLLTPGRSMARQVTDNRIWTALTVPPSSGRPLAMALPQALGRMAFLLTVGPDGGTLTLFPPDAQAVGPVDGRDFQAVIDLLSRWRFMRPDAVATALASTEEPADRIRQIADAMRLPDPLALPREKPAGVLVVEQTAGVLRGRLLAGGQGAVLLPLGDLTAVVADGPGVETDPVGLAESATSGSGGDPDRAVLVSWGPHLAIEPWGGSAGARPLAGVRSAGSASLEDAAAVLSELGLAEAPVGATPDALAAWAAARPGAILLPAVPDRRPAVLPVTDPEVVRATVRRLRRLRQAQQALGAAAVAAGAGAAIAWDETALRWSGLFAALLIVCVVLATLVGRPRRNATTLPERPRRRVPVAGRNRVGRPQLPH